MSELAEAVRRLMGEMRVQAELHRKHPSADPSVASAVIAREADYWADRIQHLLESAGVARRQPSPEISNRFQQLFGDRAEEAMRDFYYGRPAPPPAPPNKKLRW